MEQCLKSEVSVTVVFKIRAVWQLYLKSELSVSVVFKVRAKYGSCI